MTRLSGSGADRGAHRAGNRRDVGHLRRHPPVAWALLPLFGAMVAGCPLPTFEVDPDVNLPPIIDENVLAKWPEGTLVNAKIACGELVEFELEEAVSDPEGADLYGVWFIDRDGEEPSAFQGEGLNLVRTTCSLANLNDDVMQLEAYVMDTPPIELGGVPTNAPTGDGEVIHLLWVLELEAGECIDCSVE